ncbi:hypothetical protein L596_014454 [Steinernema carpocapsae]|uniref:EB domain-containing protein n=1 Tax=Steinernema carpocapsae TaxID=34508 RepID=A0A4U5ND21_STECR|nr:hypothetical protein L596_014454 [Steinernema carpocapsae]
MSLRPILILLALSLAATVTLATEMRSDVDSSAFKWFSAANFFTRGSPFRYFSRKFARIEIGTACSEDEECLAILNSTCIEGQCRCEVDFYAVKNTCVQTPGFKEACADSTSKTCRFPFQCIHGICDCPLGFKEQDGKCQKDCKAGSVLIEKENQCYAVKELGLECAYNEQCSTRYSECADGQCRCIPGTVRKGKQCISLNQCPLGETPLENGSPLVCDRDTLKCPNGTYCLYAQFSDKRGFCCPEIKMNCPVGTPLNDKDCSNCPWETHHCFSYTISSVQQQMCCPNGGFKFQDLQRYFVFRLPSKPTHPPREPLLRAGRPRVRVLRPRPMHLHCRLLLRRRHQNLRMSGRIIPRRRQMQADFETRRRMRVFEGLRSRFKHRVRLRHLPVHPRVHSGADDLPGQSARPRTLYCEAFLSHDFGPQNYDGRLYRVRLPQLAVPRRKILPKMVDRRPPQQILFALLSYAKDPTIPRDLRPLWHGNGARERLGSGRLDSHPMSAGAGLPDSEGRLRRRLRGRVRHGVSLAVHLHLQSVLLQRGNLLPLPSQLDNKH